MDKILFGNICDLAWSIRKVASGNPSDENLADFFVIAYRAAIGEPVNNLTAICSYDDIDTEPTETDFYDAMAMMWVERYQNISPDDVSELQLHTDVQVAIAKVMTQKDLRSSEDEEIDIPEDLY